MTNQPDRPDIIILPPILLGVALTVGLIVHYLLFKHTPFPLWPSRIAGGLVLIGCVILGRAAHQAFERVGTNVLPTRPALALATDGPYRYTRNPLYVVALGSNLAIALIVDSLALLLLLPIVFAILNWGVVIPEERYLERKFGQAYVQYCQRVRRWV